MLLFVPETEEAVVMAFCGARDDGDGCEEVVLEPTDGKYDVMEV